MSEQRLEILWCKYYVTVRNVYISRDRDGHTRPPEDRKYGVVVFAISVIVTDVFKSHLCLHDIEATLQSISILSEIKILKKINKIGSVDRIQIYINTNVNRNIKK